MMSHAQHRRERRRSAAPPMVRLHIERLVLHGVPARDAGAMTTAFETELARLAAAPGQRFAGIDAARAGPVGFAANRGPAETGQALAAGLWRGALGAGKG